MKKDKRAFKDGLAKIYEVITEQNKDCLKYKKQLRYDKMTIGIKRFYTALQANEHIDYLISCPLIYSMSSKNIFVLNDGKQYDIIQIQEIEDTFPASMTISLKQRKNEYQYCKDEDEEGDEEDEQQD